MSTLRDSLTDEQIACLYEMGEADVACRNLYETKYQAERAMALTTNMAEFKKYKKTLDEFNPAWSAAVERERKARHAWVKMRPIADLRTQAQPQTSPSALGLTISNDSIPRSGGVENSQQSAS